MNVIIISVDAFKKDRVGAYVNSKNSLTPNIDELAKNGAMLNQHMTVLNGSGPSQISMFTGCYPSTHGVHENGYRLPDGFKTLSEYLKEAGYTTCAAVSSGNLGSAYNFNKGFDYFFDNSKYDKLMSIFRKIGTEKYNLRKVLTKSKLFDIFCREYSKTNRDVLGWLKKHYKEKFFLFIHYYDLHEDTFGKLNNREKKEFKLANYDENVKLIDNAISEIINKLKEYNIFDDTMFIITADHGEDLTEYTGKTGHGRNITEDEFRIPCIVYKRGLIPKKVVNNLTRSVDLLPSILDLIGLKIDNAIDGVSFKKSIFYDIDIAEEAFLESYPLYGNIKGLRTRDWLYILRNGNKEELYDITKDFNLKNNLAKENKSICLKLRIKVKDHFSVKYEPEERDEYTKEMLAELGYVK